MSHEAITAHFRVTSHDGGAPEDRVLPRTAHLRESAAHCVALCDMGSMRHGRQSPFWPGFPVIHRPFNDLLHLCQARVSDKRRCRAAGRARRQWVRQGAPAGDLSRDQPAWRRRYDPRLISRQRQPTPGRAPHFLWARLTGVPLYSNQTDPIFTWHCADPCPFGDHFLPQDGNSGTARIRGPFFAPVGTPSAHCAALGR